MKKLTQNSTKADIQKATLRIIMKQNEQFTEHSICTLVLAQCDNEVDTELVKYIVAKTLEYCWREIHLTISKNGAYEIDFSRKESIDMFLRHEGVTI